jgi:hypothetical protein
MWDAYRSDTELAKERTPERTLSKTLKEFILSTFNGAR